MYSGLINVGKALHKNTQVFNEKKAVMYTSYEQKMRKLSITFFCLATYEPMRQVKILTLRSAITFSA